MRISILSIIVPAILVGCSSGETKFNSAPVENVFPKIEHIFIQ